MSDADLPNASKLSSDRPLTDPLNDRLGYADFAKHLADSICRMTPPEGLVISIYGPWGSGKSTLLGFIEHYLQAKSETERPLIVKFNPWWFSGHEDLAQRFFEQLQSSVQKLPTVGKRIAAKIANLADTLAPASIPYVSELSKPVGAVARTISRPKNVPEMKMEVAEAIKKSGKRLLVVIDDIDRLSVEEIRQLFTVVKAIADFPQVIYLLAFDRQVVERALEGIQGGNTGTGAQYLEKIVQVPLELPMLDKTVLQQLFIEHVSPVIGEFPDELEDQGRAIRILRGGINHFFNTPRDVFRIVNALTVSYVVVRGEVNPYDFVAIEALRIFSPVIYNAIRTNQDLFAGSVRWRTSDYGLDDSTISKKAFYDALLNQLPQRDQEPVKHILLALFPKLEVVWGGTGYGSDWERTWRKTLRICSSVRFDTYFRMSLPVGAISNTDLRRILGSASNPRSFEAELRRMIHQKATDGGSRIQAFLWLLQDYIEHDIPVSRVRPIIQVIILLGDEILSEEPGKQHWLFTFSGDTVVWLTIERLLKLTSEAHRYDILRSAMVSSDSFTTSVSVFHNLGKQHDLYRWPGEKSRDNDPPTEKDKLLTLEHVKQLESLVLSKIRHAAKTGMLLQSVQLRFILRFWQMLAGRKEVQQWAQATFQKDDALLSLLEHSLNHRTITNLTYGTETLDYSLDPRSLRSYVSLSEIYRRLGTLEKRTDLSEKQQIAIQRYRTAYAQLRKKGKIVRQRQSQLSVKKVGMNQNPRRHRPRYARPSHRQDGDSHS